MTLPQPSIARRRLLATAALALSAGHAAARPALPTSPIALNIIDAAGTLPLVQAAIENYRKAHPERVSRVAYSKATQPELPGKIKAQQSANRVDIDLILGGYDGLAAGFDQNIWLELLPAYTDALPALGTILSDGARLIQDQTKGQGIVITYSPYGPLLEYMPDRVPQPPTTAQELLDWCRQHNNRFIYARPANSGPARCLMVGLPYILGDSDPREPLHGWDKTWSFLQALDETIEYYPSGTGAVLKELGEGSRDMIPSTTGWDINPRALGIVPKEAEIATLKGFHWMSDAHVAAIPRGLSEDRVTVVLDLISFLLTPQQQAYTYDQGYFYPGPAVNGVTLDMAPEASQRVLQEFARPQLVQLIADRPKEPPLPPLQSVQAARRWDEQIGSRKVR